MLVIFGITGDLAKVMTFHSLYRLERRGLLDCPIVGVAVSDWSVDDLRDHARACDRGLRRADRRRGVRSLRRAPVLRAAATSATTATYAAGRQARSARRARPVFYLEIPPFLFGRVIKGLAEAGLTKTGRVVVEKPFGHDLAVGARAGRGDPPVHRRVPAVPDRPLPGEDGDRRDPLPAVRERDVRADLEPQLRLQRADHDGRELRGRGPRPLLRPGRRAARRGRQPPDAGGRGRRDGAARPRATPTCSRTRSSRCSARCRRPTPRTTCAASTRATGRSTASRADSTTETYAALRLEIDNWRWSGVPFFIRTGKCLPVTQTELRVVFRRPPRLGFAAWSRAPEPSQLVVKLDPTTGVRLLVDAQRARDGRARADRRSTWSSPQEGGEGPTPYEVLLHAALRRRQQALHPPGRRRGVLAGDAAAARQPAAGAPVREGLVGPGGGRPAARRRTDAGTSRGWRHEPRPRRRPPARGHGDGEAGGRRPRRRRAAERRRAVAVHADRRLRRSCRTATPARWSRPDGTIDWLCVPRFDSPSVFGALLDRGAGGFRLGPFGINVPSGRRYEPGTNTLVTSWKTPTGWVVVRDALTMGPRRGEDTITPHTRPPTDEDADHVLVRTVECIEGSVEIELVCEPAFDYGRVPGEWSLSPTTGTAPRRPGPIRRSGCRPTCCSGSRRSRARARHVLQTGEKLFCALVVGRGPGRSRRRSSEANAPARGDDAVLAQLARARAHPRPRVRAR